jgi:calpain-7
MKNAQPVDLVQDAATDCSVVASLCASSARAEKGHARILQDILYPWDDANNAAKISPNGKYILRLNFNGCYREVIIDDRLPTSKTKRLLHIIDRKNPSLLWPALLEKAYLKVRGGYDFPGSNSSTDLWILSGWIPEQVFLQDDTTEPDKTWKRMFSAFQYGDVLVTMGTGKMSSKLERELGLAGQHDYAVLDMKEEHDQQLVLLKNPWCKGTSWKGDIPRPPSSVRIENDPTIETSELTVGTFWIDWNNVLQHYESIYLNWNPGLFSHRTDIHFAWDLKKKQSAVGSFIDNPQFSVSCEKNGITWLLLCRHFKDSTQQDGGDAILEASGEFIGHISLYVYDCRGQRIHISTTPVERGPYVDSPQTLLRLDMPANTTYTVVVSEQNLPHLNHTFSLIAFSSMAVKLGLADDCYPFTSSLDSAWTSTTAGGGAHVVSYSSNPQFSLALERKTPIALLVETPNPEVAVNVKLVHSDKGKRVVTLSQRDIVLDSGTYRRGSAFAELQELDAGVYTIICSTFEAGQKAPFSIRVDTFVQSQLKQLPGENAGRLSQPVGMACFNRGSNKLAAPLQPKRLVKLTALAKFRSGASSFPRSPVRVSIEIGRGPTRMILGISSEGEYLDADGGGVRTPELDIWPEMRARGDMWLVLERMASPGMSGEERFAVELWCDGKPDEVIGVGVWRGWDD